MGIHAMELVHKTGEYFEFLCPVCGRRLLFSIVTKQLTTIEKGDESSAHTGITSKDIAKQYDDGKGSGIDDPWLSPFERWLKKTGR